MDGESYSPDELRELGAKVLGAKKIAHPAAPVRAGQAAHEPDPGAGTGLIDRMRDALSGRDV